MEKITSIQALDTKIASCSKCLEKKFKGEDGKRAIVICGGTGCLSAEAQEIRDTLVAKIKEHGLEDKITVNFVGCFGFCSQGPFVKIFPKHTFTINICCAVITQCC